MVNLKSEWLVSPLASVSASSAYVGKDTSLDDLPTSAGRIGLTVEKVVPNELLVGLGRETLARLRAKSTIEVGYIESELNNPPLEGAIVTGPNDCRCDTDISEHISIRRGVFDRLREF